MPDTARTFSQIIALLPDQTTEDISPQDLRDAMQSIATPIQGGGFMDTVWGMPLGLANAAQSTRFVGARASSPPASGTWILGDFMVLQNGGFAVCTAAGTPGTWVTITASGTINNLGLADYIVYKSGSNYIAHNNATGVDDYSSTNAASVVQSAHDALGKAGLIELRRGIEYDATTMVTLSQNGVIVRSSEQNGEDMSTLWKVTSALSAGSAAFRLTGIGAAIGGISVDANSNADYGIDLRGSGELCFSSNAKNADVANFYLDGPAGAQRCTIWGLRSDNPASSGAINYKFDGPDHIAWGLRATGAATNGYALWMDTQRMQIASGHITGNGPEAACVFISGAENRLSTLYLDTGPDGTNGQAHVVMQGQGNYLQALIQNASCKSDYPSPAVAGILGVTSVAFVSGTTYRFTTPQDNLLHAGDAVWLEGFASSNGFFQSTTSGNVLVTASSNPGPSGPYTFDADLGATTTFTDQVGTAKRITKYALLLQKSGSTSFVQGNEFHITTQGKGAAPNNTGEFYYALGILDETGANPSNLARYAGNRIYMNAAHATRFSNLEATWGTITNVDKLFVDAWGYQNDTTTPIPWRTRAKGKTSASTGTSWTINHGLAGIPNDVQITPAVDPGSGVRWWVSSVTATQIVITSSASITSAAWYWQTSM